MTSNKFQLVLRDKYGEELCRSKTHEVLMFGDGAISQIAMHTLMEDFLECHDFCIGDSVVIEEAW